jgi:hypothetical protein
MVLNLAGNTDASGHIAPRTVRPLVFESSRFLDPELQRLPVRDLRVRHPDADAPILATTDTTTGHHDRAPRPGTTMPPPGQRVRVLRAWSM